MERPFTSAYILSRTTSEISRSIGQILHVDTECLSVTRSLRVNALHSEPRNLCQKTIDTSLYRRCKIISWTVQVWLTSVTDRRTDTIIAMPRLTIYIAQPKYMWVVRVVQLTVGQIVIYWSDIQMSVGKCNWMVSWRKVQCSWSRGSRGTNCSYEIMYNMSQVIGHFFYFSMI